MFMGRLIVWYSVSVVIVLVVLCKLWMCSVLVGIRCLRCIGIGVVGVVLFFLWCVGLGRLFLLVLVNMI